jgi:pyrroline-5-carboxylate reductase
VSTTVFLGGGRITGALVAGLRLAKYDRPIVVHDRHAEKLRRLKRDSGVTAESNLERAVKAADLLIIAVRPDSVAGMLKEVATFPYKRNLIVVSLAAGIPLSKLSNTLKSPVSWVRAMPSPVCRSGQGLTAIAFARNVSAPRRKTVRDFFALVGTVVEIPDKQFDAFTITFSSSHGYHALDALIEAAVTIGLDRKTAQFAAVHGLAGGIAPGQTGKLNLEELLHEAATPGGTAAATMKSLDNAGYQAMLTEALRAGMRRAKLNAATFG